MTTMRIARCAAAALTAAGWLGCATAPTGPSVLVLPGSHSSFEQFQRDDDDCRDFAFDRSGARRGDPAQRGVAEAAAATAVGAAAGAAIGAAAGDAAEGAAIGAGSGLILGSARGVDRAERSAGDLQRRYDHAYVQCMYAKGHQVPVPQSLARDRARGRMRERVRERAVPPPSEPIEDDDWQPPPPPHGAPPPPPPDANDG